MKLSRSVAIGTLAWVLVVALGSTLVWQVISRAGREVVATGEPVPGPTGSPSGSPAGSPTGKGAGSPTGSPTGSPSGSSAPTTERRTWQGTGGLVVAQCRGAAVSLSSTQPDTGYAVDLKDRGPERLEVEFEGRQDDFGRRTRVEARCVGGVPQFDATTDSSGGGGEGGDD